MVLAYRLSKDTYNKKVLSIMAKLNTAIEPKGRNTGRA